MNLELTINKINNLEELKELESGSFVDLTNLFNFKTLVGNSNGISLIRRGGISGVYTGITKYTFDFEKTNEIQKEWCEYGISFLGNENKPIEYRIVIREGNYGNKPCIEVLEKNNFNKFVYGKGALLK